MNKLISTIFLITAGLSSNAYGENCGDPDEAGTYVEPDWYASEAQALTACEAADLSGGYGASGTGVCKSGTSDGYTIAFFMCQAAGSNSNRTRRFKHPSDFWGTTVPPQYQYEDENGRLSETDPDTPIVCESPAIALIDTWGEVSACIVTADPDLDGDDDPLTCGSQAGVIGMDTLCEDAKGGCSAIGGSFGYYGSGENMDPVCIGSGLNAPDCASGSVIIVGDGAVCTPPDQVSNDICDSSKYDCDGDGNIDDQDGNGLKDNGIANTGANGGTGTEAEDENTGYDPLDTPVSGAGECDPTSTNYAECTGQNALDPPVEYIEHTDGQISFESIDTEMTSRIENSPIMLAINGVSAPFQAVAVCPSPSITIFGSVMQLDGHCGLYENISGILSVLMIVLYSITAVRHIASA